MAFVVGSASVHPITYVPLEFKPLAPVSNLAREQPPFYTPLTLIMTEPIVSRRKVPPFAKPIHHERLATPAVPQYNVAESSARPVGTVPTHMGSSGGNNGRPFTPQNLEAPGKFSYKGQPTTTT